MSYYISCIGKDSHTLIMAEKVKISFAQIASKPGDIKANLDKLSDYAQLASKGNAKILITPELFLTGYTVKPASKLRDLAIPIQQNQRQHHVIDRIASISMRYNIDIIIGLPERFTDNICYNTAVWMSNKGKIRYIYRKTHLWGKFEHSIFTPYPKDISSPYKIINCFGMNFGVLICYDVEFVEPARILSLKGADCILVLTACPGNENHILNTIVPSRAVENSLHIVYCNFPKPFCGGSCCVAPNGKKIANAGYTDDALLFATIDNEKFRELRERNNYLDDRRAELYSEILNERQKLRCKL